MNSKKAKQADYQCEYIKKLESMTNESLLNKYASTWMTMGMDYVTEEDFFELEMVTNELTKRLKNLGFLQL